MTSYPTSQDRLQIVSSRASHDSSFPRRWLRKHRQLEAITAMAVSFQTERDRYDEELQVPGEKQGQAAVAL